MKKKLLLCLLALVLCVALFGCSFGNDKWNPDNNAGNSGGSDGEGSASKPVTICDGSFTPDKSSDLFKYLCGTWQRVLKTPVWNIETIVIGEDGSCTVDGEAYEITFCKESTEDCYQLHVHRDGKTDYLLYVAKWTYDDEAYDVVMGIGGYHSHDAVMALQDTYWNAAQVRQVQITPDNWQEYFEVKDTMKVEKNAFGEITHVTVGQRMVLKAPYRLSRWAEHDAAIEFAFSSANATAQADLENLTLAVSEVLSTGDRGSRIVEVNGSRNLTSIMENSGRYSIENGQVFSYWVDFEVLRSVGSLYLLK